MPKRLLRRRHESLPLERPGQVFTEGRFVPMAEMEDACRERLRFGDVPSWRDDETYDLRRQRRPAAKGI